MIALEVFGLRIAFTTHARQQLRVITRHRTLVESLPPSAIYDPWWTGPRCKDLCEFIVREAAKRTPDLIEMIDAAGPVEFAAAAPEPVPADDREADRGLVAPTFTHFYTTVVVAHLLTKS